jgi:hypothetical protein
MRKVILALAASALPALASAQVSASAGVQLDLRLPVVLPQLVVVTPGVQVVPDVDEEVFFVDGWYWVRHPRGWHKSKSHKHGWVLVPAARVPGRLVGFAPGQYRRYKPGKRDHDHRHDGHHDRRDDDRGGKGKGHGGKHGGKHGKD